jgi:uracil-DNA glycosylase family 4
VKREATLRVIEKEVCACRKCPRLVKYREKVARAKRRAFREWEYWGRGVPGFGDPHARLFILGLAPAAHGANRTGRMFTGDRSGDFLYRALFETGFASQPESRAMGDGLKLEDAYITAAVRCAPPDNKPAPGEFKRCRPYLERELDLLKQVRVVVALGKLAANTYLGILRDRGVIRSRAQFPFGHGREHIVGANHMDVNHPILLWSYHPSQQNTATGKLTAEMLREVFARARAIIHRQGSSQRGC